MTTLKQALQKLSQTGDEIYAKICEVVQVDTPNLTADLQPLDGSAMIYDAYLQVDDNGIFIAPKVGSLVACVFVSKEMAVVVNHSVLQEFQIQIEQTHFRITDKGFALRKNEVDFKEVFNELLTALKQAIIQTPAGVGNFAPSSVTKLNQISEKINQLFE